MHNTIVVHFLQNNLNWRNRELSVNVLLIAMLNGDHSVWYSEIIKQLRAPLAGEPLRPTLSAQMCDEALITLLNACWSENPDQRPPFTSIRRRLREISPERYKQKLINTTYYNNFFVLL